LIVLGAVLRLITVWSRAPDGDEIFTLAVAQSPIGKIVSYSILTDYNPPLFYLSAHLATLTGGASIAAVRFPSVIFGVLLIPLVYLIGRELDGEDLGLISAGFITLLYPAIYYSQYARSFAMEMFAFSVVILAFIRILKDKDAWLLFTVSGLIALYIHAFAVVPLAFMVLYLIHIRQIRYNYLIGMSIAAIPFILMMYVIGLHRHYAYGFSPLKVAGLMPLEFFGYGSPVVLALIAWACMMYLNRYDLPLIAVPLLTCLSAILIAPFTPVFPRYALLVMPLLAVVAMVTVARWIRDGNYKVFYIALVSFLAADMVQVMILLMGLFQQG